MRRRPNSPATAWLGLLVLALLLQAPLLPAGRAGAAIPAAGKVLDATADQNRKSGRARGLRLDVALRFEGDDEPVAVGVLWTHPDGRVGLELRAGAGFVERHVLREGRVYASRDGAPVEAPRPFLPPVHLLQIGSEGDLARALRALGVDSGQVALGHAGDHDCYVLGGRGEGRASLWVDLESLVPVGFDRGDGVRWRSGPPKRFGEIELPGFVEVFDPGHRAARLEVGAAEPASVPPMDVEWLEAPGRAANEVR